jgi:hypothetical protein
MSHSLNEAQYKYTTTEKELYAIVKALEKFDPYIYGKEFHIHTDHRVCEPICFSRLSTFFLHVFSSFSWIFRGVFAFCLRTALVPRFRAETGFP